ncbi:MAG: hypothetical protein R3Y28_05295 [Candidatus Gastranaerophilales bacterium]
MFNQTSNSNIVQLNPFEVKAEIAKLSQTLSGVKDLENYQIHLKTLDNQDDKEIITKILLKEIPRIQNNGDLIKFLLKRYSNEDLLVEYLWNLVKNQMTSNQTKIFALDLLRESDANWSYETCEEYLDNPNDFVNEDTRKILDSAILNPEVQIDFLDFLRSIAKEDKLILLRSLAQDYSNEELANILIPVFLSQSDSEIGLEALKILGNSKSQLAFHSLNSALEIVPSNLHQAVKKSLSTLKLAGIREDNALEFYKDILKNTTPYKACITYPDGQGNIAFIFSRINKVGKVQFAAIVADDYHGIRDCFGFNDISQFECNTIIEKFYKNEKQINLSPSTMKALLEHYEKISQKTNNWLMPYEYVCWKNLLADTISEPKNIYDYIKENLKLQTVTNKELEFVTKSDFTAHWFLDENYSDEFDEFLNKIKNTTTDKFEELITSEVNNVFYPSEYETWSKRMQISAFIKLTEELKVEAEKIYSLSLNEELKTKFFKNILRVSIYQYYFSQKTKNVVGADEIVNQIEKMWVS